MKHYDNLRVVPADALKPIDYGKLKGKSDINPQWRIEAMTKEFGPCGVGWRYEIVKTWTQEAPDSQLMVFVEVAVFVKEDGEWSAPIPGVGGDFLIEKDKNGLHGNDEAYKMATTDALGVAFKMLGVAADVYRGLANDSKYGRQQQPKQAPAQQPKPAPQAKPDPALLAQLSDLCKKLELTEAEKKELATKHGGCGAETNILAMIAELEQALVDQAMDGEKTT